MFSRCSDEDLESFFAKRPQRTKNPETFSKDLFIDHIPEEVLCRICSQVNKKPLSCVDCSSVFCKECVEKARGSPIFFFNNSDISCPSCHHRTVRDAPRAFRKKIESLEIRCSECQESFQLFRLKEHTNQCLRARVTCAKENCHKYGTRSNFLSLTYAPPWASAIYCKTEYFACSKRCKMLIEFELVLKDDKTKALEFYHNLLSRFNQSNR